jgi:hypothetical protein
VGRLIAEAPGALLFGVGYLWIAFDKQRQGWHDKLAETYVLRVPAASGWRTASVAGALGLVVVLAVAVGASGFHPAPAIGPGCPAGGLPHQDPELEAVMPAQVSGRPLYAWSVRGRCWAGSLLRDDPAAGQKLAELERIADEFGIDVENASYAFAGRADVEHDPPYAIHAVRLPFNYDERDLAMGLFRNSIGFIESRRAVNLGLYRDEVVGGRAVRVGGEWMMEQDEHQRGRPYLVETGDYVFVIVTDDEAWAADAIAQLP